MPALPSPTTSIAHPLRASRRTATEDMVQRFATIHGTPLTASAVALPSGARVLVDGLSEDGSVIVAAHPIPTPVRDIDLVALVRDVFKLALVRAGRPEARAVLLVADEGVRRATAAAIARRPAAGVVEIVVCP